MKRFFSLIRFGFTTLLILTGTLAVVVLFARVIVFRPRSEIAQIIIAPDSTWSVPALTTESRQLEQILVARAAEINTAPAADPTLFYFPIKTGETAQTVAQRLQAAGLVSDANLFTQLLRYNRLDTHLQAGDYYFRRTMTMRDIGLALYWGRSALRTVTIPAGWRMEQLADYLTTAGIMDGDLFLQQARQGGIINHPMLADRPAGKSYEGYLFPGAYLLPDQPTPADLIFQMLNNLARQLPANTGQLAQQQGLTFYQILTVASIVEREAVLEQERPLIAGVYLNRLKPGSTTPYLQADPTVQYALGYQPEAGQWWKSPMRLEEYSAVDSPYNTYLYRGLPPGPIASPGLASILAVLQPADHTYLFFVCRHPDCAGGEHIFAETYDEHLKNVANYWGQ